MIEDGQQDHSCLWVKHRFFGSERMVVTLGVPFEGTCCHFTSDCSFLFFVS